MNRRYRGAVVGSIWIAVLAACGGNDTPDSAETLAPTSTSTVSASTDTSPGTPDTPADEPGTDEQPMDMPWFDLEFVAEFEGLGTVNQLFAVADPTRVVADTSLGIAVIDVESGSTVFAETADSFGYTFAIGDRVHRMSMTWGDNFESGFATDNACTVAIVDVDSFSSDNPFTDIVEFARGDIGCAAPVSRGDLMWTTVTEYSGGPGKHSVVAVNTATGAIERVPLPNIDDDVMEPQLHVTGDGRTVFAIFTTFGETNDEGWSEPAAETVFVIDTTTLAVSDPVVLPPYFYFFQAGEDALYWADYGADVMNDDPSYWRLDPTSLELQPVNEEDYFENIFTPAWGARAVSMYFTSGETVLELNDVDGRPVAKRPNDFDDETMVLSVRVGDTVYLVAQVQGWFGSGPIDDSFTLHRAVID